MQINALNFGCPRVESKEKIFQKQTGVNARHYTDRVSFSGNIANETTTAIKKLEYTELKSNLKSKILKFFNSMSHYPKTLTKGDIAHPLNNPMEKKHLSSLFETMLKLDKNEIFHGDIDPSHIICSKDGKIALKYFKFAEEMPFAKPQTQWKGDKGNLKFKFPDFIAPSNALMFEHAGFFQYFDKLIKTKGDKGISKSEELFSHYVKKSATYHLKRASILSKKNAPENYVKYEKLAGKFLKDPSKDILKLQATKVQFLYGAREGFTHFDEYRRASTFPAYFSTLLQTQKFIIHADNMAQNAANPQLKEYLNIEKEIGHHWFNNTKNSMPGMFDWAVKNNFGHETETTKKGILRTNMDKTLKTAIKSLEQNNLDQYKKLAESYMKDFKKLTELEKSDLRTIGKSRTLDDAKGKINNYLSKFNNEQFNILNPTFALDLGGQNRQNTLKKFEQESLKATSIKELNTAVENHITHFFPSSNEKVTDISKMMYK